MSAGRIARLTLLALAALFAAAILATREISLGVDLRGGTRFEYAIATGDEAVAERTRQAVEVRIANTSPGWFAVSRDGLRLDVTLMDSETAARRALERRGRLEIMGVDDLAALPIGTASLPEGIAKRNESLGAIQTTLLAATGPRAQSRLRAFVATLPMSADRRILIGPDDANGARSYVVETEDAVEGDFVDDASVVRDPVSGRPEIWLRYDTEGAAAFERLSATHVGARLAIVVDDVVVSAPLVLGRIGGGNVRITLARGEDAEDAAALAAALRAGALPAAITLISQQRFGGTVPIGQQQIAIVVSLAILFAISIVALVRYRRRGLIIAAGLPLTVLFELAIFAAFGAVISSFSFAGALVGPLLFVAGSVIFLEARQKPWRPAAIFHGGAFGASLVLSILTRGPLHGLAFGALASALAAVLVAFLTASSLVGQRN